MSRFALGFVGTVALPTSTLVAEHVPPGFGQQIGYDRDAGIGSVTGAILSGYTLLSFLANDFGSILEVKFDGDATTEIASRTLYVDAETLDLDEVVLSSGDTLAYYILPSPSFIQDGVSYSVRYVL